MAKTPDFIISTRSNFAETNPDSFQSKYDKFNESMLDVLEESNSMFSHRKNMVQNTNTKVRMNKVIRELKLAK